MCQLLKNDRGINKLILFAIVEVVITSRFLNNIYLNNPVISIFKIAKKYIQLNMIFFAVYL